MTILSLEVCQRLKEWGFPPQGKFPQMVLLYSDRGKEMPGLLTGREYWTRDEYASRSTFIPPGASYVAQWCAAPSPLQALMWLESEKGWQFLRSSPNDRLLWWADHPTMVERSSLFPHGHYPEADTAEGLVEAILKRMSDVAMEAHRVEQR